MTFENWPMSPGDTGSNEYECLIHGLKSPSMPKNSADPRGPCAAGFDKGLTLIIGNRSKSFWLKPNARKRMFDGILKLAGSRLQGQKLNAETEHGILAHLQPMAMATCRRPAPSELPQHSKD